MANNSSVGGAGAVAPSSTGSQTPQQANALARRMLIPGPNTQTVRRIQQIFSTSSQAYVAGQQLTFNVNPAPVGIITRFLVKVTASIGIGNAETQTRVQNGAAAFFSNVQYIDTSNQTRVNCPSWYLNQLSSLRRRRLYAGAITTDINSVSGLGANFTAGIFAAPSSLTAAPPANNAPNFSAYFEIPLAYGPDDLRGAVLAALINATQQLNLTVNPNFFVTSTDTVNIAEAAYQSSSTQLGKINNLTITIYQEYIDQFGGLNLPQIDLATQYLLQVSGGYVPVANTDLIIPYANFRLFMSTIFRYNNNGTFNTGSDINYVAIRTANQSDLIHVDPLTLTLLNRDHMSDDLPAGYYTVNHRAKPLFTNQFGNLSLVVQASSVGGANSSISVGYEQLALMNQLPASGAIPSGS
jgi:P3 major capsid protein